MVVTCLLGMRIPAGPVSKRNPALSVSCYRRISTFRKRWALSWPDRRPLSPLGSSKKLNEEKHRG